MACITNTNKKDVLIRLSANDIGFIRWDEGCTNLYIDTAYHFEGIAVNDLLDFNQEILENEIDALEGQINSPVQESYTWKIPILLRGYYEQKISRIIISMLLVLVQNTD